MCGIAALFNTRGVNPHTLQKMASCIRHRGPDDEGFVFFSGDSQSNALGGPDTPDSYFDKDLRRSFPYLPDGRMSRDANFTSENIIFAGLAHRRLSIVDVSPAGHQPMVTQNRYWLVYNGEIYNHIELRAELENIGCRFASHSDTEVILHAYSQWGKACLSRFNGMFAFVLFDTATKEVFAARDRFGVKPLYYYLKGSEAAFASEIKQFTFIDGWTARLNPLRGYDFLAYSTHEHTDETFFSGVYQIPPGHYFFGKIADLCASSEKLETEAWYSFPENLRFRGSFEEASTVFRELLTDSIRLRLRADVPVGSCLSGGLDSSAIVCLMSELLRNQNAADLQQTFSACALDKRFDERDYIESVIRHTGVNGHFVYPSVEELLDISQKITWHQDQPFGSTSIFAQWKVFELARKHNVKVMLDGQGADEQLGGYASFFLPWLTSLVRSFRLVRLYREARGLNQLHGVKIDRLLWFTANSFMPVRIKDFLKKQLRGETPAPEWLDTNRLGASPYNLPRQLGISGKSIREMSFSQITRSNLQMLLHYEDRDSMAHSVESRVPFLDYRLVEHVYSLPDSYKIVGGKTKYVLREALKNSLPETIYNRHSKLGFATPEEVWVRQNAPEAFKQRLKWAVETSNGIIKPSALSILDKQISGEIGFSFLTWRLISFAEWVKVFNVVV
jgi:asparagine synthase (glutamine-hydrolysing)